MELSLKVIHAGPSSFLVNNTLVMGEKEAVLIDVPFTRSQAHRVVAEILESNLELKYIYITHSHPDHYFSANVLNQAFPNAELIAIPKIALNIGISAPGRLNFWSPMLGANGPGNPVIPKPYYESYMELEGSRLEILGPLHGDHNESTVIHIPSIDAIIASDLLFNGLHMFTAHGLEEHRRAWVKSLDYLLSLKLKTVVAGHTAPGASKKGTEDGIESLEYARHYLFAFEEEVLRTNTSDELIAAMRKRYPEAQDLFDGFILKNSAKVAKGERPPSMETAGLFDTPE
jgi:glyoxylase-like metal-dependent hydrolase (beta-lactamase superfamily II)